MSKNRFSIQEENAVLDEIWILLTRGLRRNQIIQYVKTKYNRSERHIDRYLAKVRQQMSAFGSQSIDDHRGRLLSRVELIYAQAWNGSEIDVNVAIKALTLETNIIKHIKEDSNVAISSAKNAGPSAGLLDALRTGRPQKSKKSTDSE